MRRSEVPTPALLVDIDILDRNIALMRDGAAQAGVKLRPHAKAHKCVEIAQRIMAAGAIGISCATIGEADKIFQFAELGGQKISVLGEPKDFGVPAPGSELNTTRQNLKDLRPRLKAFFMAYSEAIAAGRRNRELAYQVFRKYMRVDNPKLLDFTYRVQFMEAIPAKPYPREDSIQASIEDLRETTPKLEGMKATDFFDASLIKELDSVGFFAKLAQ